MPKSLYGNTNVNSEILRNPLTVGLTATTTGNTYSFSGNSNNEILRITQSGPGNSFIVEDTNRPDSTPFIIDSSGNTGIGVLVPLQKLHVSGDTLLDGSLSATTISATTYQNLPLNGYGTGLTFNTGNYDLTIDGGNGVLDTVSLSVLASDLTVTGGTYNPNTGIATFTNNTGGTFNVTGFLTGFTDTYVSGSTYNDNAFTFTNTSGSTFNVSFNTVTGLTSTGTISSNTISATTYQNLPTTVTANTATIHFTGNTVFGSYSSPLSSNITDDLTNSKLGITQKIYHNSGSAPTVPAGWVLLGSTTYQISTVNIIYAEWSEGTRVEYWIVR